MEFTVKEAIEIINNQGSTVAEMIYLPVDQFNEKYKIGDIYDFGVIKGEVVKLSYFPLAEEPCGIVVYKLKGRVELINVL